MIIAPTFTLLTDKISRVHAIAMDSGMTHWSIWTYRLIFLTPSSMEVLGILSYPHSDDHKSPGIRCWQIIISHHKLTRHTWALRTRLNLRAWLFWGNVLAEWYCTFKAHIEYLYVTANKFIGMTTGWCGRSPMTLYDKAHGPRCKWATRRRTNP